MTTTSMITAPEQRCEQVLLSPNWHRPFQLACKRVLDILVSALSLILLAPLFLVLASRGQTYVARSGLLPVESSRQERLSVHRLQFRSMVTNADELKAKLEAQNEMTGPMFKITNDPRVTPVGAWMRKYSLDELPQLYSVLKGDMSLVGPRPPLVTEYEKFTAYQKQKLAVKPGITCLWQVSGRNDINDFDQWVSLDLEYIRNWSQWLDLQILLRTVRAVVSGSGK